MTKTVLHGENQKESRSNYIGARLKEKKLGNSIYELDGTKISLAELESVLKTQNLFGGSALFIENLLSRPLSLEKKKLLSLLKDYPGPKNIYLWEKKAVTKTAVKSLGDGVGDLNSRLPQEIFIFLDSLRYTNKKSALIALNKLEGKVEEGFLFIMLSRHLASLLVAQSGDTSKLSPWSKTKLINQAKDWPTDILILLIRRLLDVDLAIKSGQTKLGYLDHIDLLLASLLR